MTRWGDLAPGCKEHDKPEGYYTPLPYGDGHCEDCHCFCEDHDPTCGHWVGCPGC